MSKLKFWDMVWLLVFLAGALLFGAGCMREGTVNLLLCLAGGLVMAAGAAIGRVKLHCPHCGRFLGLGFGPSRHRAWCPHCGGYLMETEKELREGRAFPL